MLPRNNMERYYSNTFLPQDFTKPAKHNLVKLIRCESETNLIFQPDILSMGDHAFKPKKRKSSILSKSTQELSCKGDKSMAPSSAGMKRKVTPVSSQDDLWKLIQSNYTFLMADDLIAECQETQSELHLSPMISTKQKETSHKTHKMLTFSEFQERFNRLHDTLHSLQTSNSSVDLNETQSNQFYSECQYLKDQALLLKMMNPEIKDDVDRRCNILSNKMNILERSLFPKRTQEKDGIMKGLTNQMKDIRKWLQEVEGKLRKMKISDDCAIDDINEIFSQEKTLQREIEGQGKELTSIVRQCQTLEGATPAESKRLRRAAAHLERSWHNIWIRSLEKQCLTEQRLLQRQSEENNRQEASDFELDEGPLNKHRRLTLDKWTAVASVANMDKMRRDRETRTNDVIKSNLLTRDVGVLCSDLVPVNDKCIMVGTTGIAALKAEYGDDFTNFEIIQDVGYSSESSTHLSSDDGISVGGDRYFNIRVYNYSNTKSPCISLKEELENADSKQPHSLASSVGSSSGAPSFNDSGLGSNDVLGTVDSADVLNLEPGFANPSEHCDNFVENEVYIPGEESDFLETVLESCVDFCVSDGGKETHNESHGDLQYNLSSIESDDSVDNFHNRSSFTTSSQLFYKMISVDSDNDETETRVDGNIEMSNIRCLTNVPRKLETCTDSSSVGENRLSTSEEKLPLKNELHSSSSKLVTLEASKNCNDLENNSKQPQFDGFSPEHDRRSMGSWHTPNLKRKRDCDSTDFSTKWDGEERTPLRVRSWLKRCSNPSDQRQRSARRCLFRSHSDHSSCDEAVTSSRNFRVCEDVSSCDASGEYTSSSADEGNALSSSSSFFEDDVLTLKERLDSYSGGGSVETVIRGVFNNSIYSDAGGSVELGPLLPPPLSSTPSCIRSGQCKSNVSRCCNYSSYPFENHICGDMRWLTMKASSEGDLRSRPVHIDGCLHQLSNLSTNKDLMKGCSGSSAYDSKLRLSSSLPNVLRHRSYSSSDDVKSSIRYISNEKTFEQTIGQDESLTSFVSTNLSSSSDPEKRKKRRNRKKSSSSNRSSRSVLTSGDNSRNRSKTLTTPSNRSNSRMRHLSQRSDFYEDSITNLLSESEGFLAKINIETVEELNHKTLKDELELALEDSRNSTILLSPADSDVVLTQLEEQSIASDQVWDGYQDMPYLSEAYSEATVDEDAIRKLTEFGDDYGSAIGQPLRFLDSAGSTNSKTDAPKSPCRKSLKAQIQAPVSDSDSDLEDLHHVIEEAEKALQFARVTLKRRQAGDFFSSAENAELLATCGTHLHWLQTICEYIEIDQKENTFSTSDIKELHYLIEEWKRLKISVEMYEEADDSAKEKYLRAQQSIDVLLHRLSELSSITDMDTKTVRTWDELKESIVKLQMMLTTLQETREQLIAVNLQVHRFMTEYGTDLNYRSCSLKDDVTELYQRWDDIYEQNGAHLTELQTLNSQWNAFDDKLQSLHSKVKEAENISVKQDCDQVYLQSEESKTEFLQKDLNLLKLDVEFLQGHLTGVTSWRTVKNDLQELEKRIQKQTHKLFASRKVDHSNSSTDEDDPDDQFEDAIQLLDSDNCRYKRNKTISPSQVESTKKDAANAKRKSSRLGRILRVAVPVQLTLVLLFCLACYLEPNCCDRLNNFNFSFTPHLRYLYGPPPV